MVRNCEVWKIDDIVGILCKIGVDRLLSSSNVLFTDIIENILQITTCDFSENFLTKLNQLDFLVTLRLKFRNVGLREDEYLSQSEDLVKFCCHALRSQICDEIRTYFPLLSDILVKCLLLMDRKCYHVVALDILQECTCSIRNDLSTGRVSSRENVLLRVANYNSNITANCVIFESVLESLQLAADTGTSLANIEHEGLSKFLTEDSLCETVIKLSMCGSKDIVLHTLTSLIPRLSVFNHSILTRLWSEICHHSGDTSYDSNKVMWDLLDLCALVDYYFPNTNTNDRLMNLISSDALWKMFQAGFVHVDPVVRKQALYLMKRTIDSIVQNKLTVAAGNSHLTLFWWQLYFQEEFVRMWEKYFVILETLEETQVHLVRPVVYLVEELISKTTVLSHNLKHASIHITWVMCIFERILHHDNSLIVKWGIINLNCHKFHFVSHHNEYATQFLISFIQVLNDSSLYTLNQEEFSAIDLKDAIQGVLTSFTKLSPHRAREIFADILRKVTKIPWGSVALFYFSNALAGVSGTEAKVLDSKSISLFGDFARNALANQNVFIRGGVQCFLIQSITNLLDSRDVELFAIANILGDFRSSECLKRGTCSWDLLVKWLNNFVDTTTAVNFAVKHLASITSSERKDFRISEPCLARMLVLMWDAGCLVFPFDTESNPVSNHLLKLAHSFRDADRRLYASGAVQDACLKLLVSLLEESESVTLLPNDRVRKAVVSLAGACISGVVVFILRRLKSASHLADYDAINSLVRALKTFSRCSDFVEPFYIELDMLHSTARHILCRNDPPIRKYFASHVLVWTVQFIEAYPDSQAKPKLMAEQERLLLKIIGEGIQNYVPIKDESCEGLMRDSSSIWGRVVSGYMHNIWSMLAVFLRASTGGSNAVVCTAGASIFDAALDCVQIGGKDILQPLLEISGHFLNQVTSKDVNSALKLLSLSWNTMFELRKTELFWLAFKAFVNAVFTERVLQNPLLLPVAVQYAHDILDHGLNIPKLSNALLQQLNDEVCHTSVSILDPFADVLAEALIFGPVHRKDLRIVNSTCDYIESFGSQLSVNILLESDSQANNKVRALAVQLLLLLVRTPDGHQTALRVMEHLRQKDKVASAQKPFYHKDSLLHRLKHRVLQAMLILQTILPLAESEALVEWLYECLLLDTPQPSVRYMQEWLLVLLLHKHPQLCNGLWDAIQQQARETRKGSVCSFISVLFHTACHASLDRQQFIDRTVQEILPYTMCHHFVVRAYAKVALMKLFKLCEKQKFDCLVEKYSLVEKALHLRMEQGNPIKALDKLLDEFYFSVFNPIHHFTIETIFYELPRLTNITQEEWIPVAVFQSLSHFQSTEIPLKNADSHLGQLTAAEWIVKSTVEEESGTIVQAQVDVQKKIVPWKSMVPNHEDSRRPRVDGGLVVVASLIDRSPNLGGLSRTCEVFGVSQYVLGSLKYAEDKQFQNVSVSADKWITMLEVKPHALPHYLQAMKQEGYLVVGIEQTANSTRLDKMKFPKKSLLLLGNEKEGIPANLLPLMDVCVEVPQYGVIRSLNVHVAGAIIMWQYYQQHLLDDA